MNIVNEIKHNKFTLKKFVEYIISKKYDINKIVSNDNHMETIMYFIEFLESENIHILVDHNAYCCYKQFDESIQITIECEFIPNVIAKNIMGIIKSFNYLENPF